MNNPRTIVGLIIMLAGVSALFEFPFFKILFACLLIYIGYRIITGAGRDWSYPRQTESKDDDLKQVFIFSGINKKILSSNFEKAEVVAVFGGGEVDLSGVKTDKKTIPMDFVAIFGGLKIILPKDWNVRSEGVGIVGGFTNKTTGVESGKVTAHVKGVAIFGGVEITDL